MEKRHNSNFWKLIKMEFKDYEKKEKDLLIYWFLIQKRKLKKVKDKKIEINFNKVQKNVLVMSLTMFFPLL